MQLLFISVITLFIDVQSYNTLEAIKPQINSTIQELAVSQLIKRLLPNRYEDFTIKINSSLEIDGKELFRLTKNPDGTINIEGSTGVAASSGFHYYLKYYCNCHISWEVSQLYLPIELPDVNLTKLFNDKFRYYQNVCTTSYSFVWWNWNQWEKHIDWMVLNSFNLVLTFNGQEEIWRRVYKKLNLTDDDINDHFSGPAFLAWMRMGNIRKWAGPLSNTWHNQSLILQHKILNRMRSFGIITILPAFAGHVPRAFKRVFPNAQMTKLQNWNKFPEPYCCIYFLNPTDDLFRLVGKMFIMEQIKEYGTDHVYNCDSFNEVNPPNNSLSYISDVGKNIYQAMLDADTKAIWIMQGWLFVHSFFFWTTDRVKSLLTSVPIGKMIILDLQSEQFPQYQRFQQYFGQPYIWCMLHNFGGTLGMFGSVNIINEAVISARNTENSTLIGTGLTMEGINQNYVIYDLMTESAWQTTSTNLSKWFQMYSRRRYGKSNRQAEEAWQILKNTIYDFNGLERMHGQYVITKSPDLNINPWTWYNYTQLFEAWNLLFNASTDLYDSKGYLHDLVDLTRQVLQVNGDICYNKLMSEFHSNDIEKFQKTSGRFLDIFNDLESVLETNEAFLLGKWLNAAKALATNDMERISYEYNARNQITLWGPFGEIKNYAIKQWSGITKDFLYPRWKVFINYLNISLLNNSTFDQKKVKSIIFWQYEEPFCSNNNSYPTIPRGDTIEVVRTIRQKRWYTNFCID